MGSKTRRGEAEEAMPMICESGQPVQERAAKVDDQPSSLVSQ